MSKKVKVPVMLRMVRWLFPRLEKYSPHLATRLFVQLFFTPLHYGFPEKELEWVNSANKLELAVNGKRLQVYSWGKNDDPIILFVHGWAGRATQFRKFFPAFLKAGFRVVAFDGPAHGKSGGKRTNILEFNDALKKVFEAVGQPLAVVTHSFGGVASMYGAMQGLPIKKLVNIGTPVVGDKIIQTFLTAVNGSWSTVERFKEYMMRKYNRTFDDFTIQRFIPQMKSLPQLLLVHDEDDKDVTIDHAETLLGIYPGALLHRTSGLGHTRILKDDTVIDVVLKFIQPKG